MKKIFNLFILTLCCISLLACSDENDETDEEQNSSNDLELISSQLATDYEFHLSEEVSRVVLVPILFKNDFTIENRLDLPIEIVSAKDENNVNVEGVTVKKSEISSYLSVSLEGDYQVANCYVLFSLDSNESFEDKNINLIQISLYGIVYDVVVNIIIKDLSAVGTYRHLDCLSTISNNITGCSRTRKDNIISSKFQTNSAITLNEIYYNSRENQIISIEDSSGNTVALENNLNINQTFGLRVFINYTIVIPDEYISNMYIGRDIFFVYSINGVEYILSDFYVITVTDDVLAHFLEELE